VKRFDRCHGYLLAGIDVDQSQDLRYEGRMMRPCTRETESADVKNWPTNNCSSITRTTYL
jgi:hypothetical protein